VPAACTGCPDCPAMSVICCQALGIGYGGLGGLPRSSAHDTSRSTARCGPSPPERVIRGGADPRQIWGIMGGGFNLNCVTTPLRLEAIGLAGVPLEWEPYAGLLVQHKPAELFVIPEGEHVLVTRTRLDSPAVAHLGAKQVTTLTVSVRTLTDIASPEPLGGGRGHFIHGSCGRADGCSAPDRQARTSGRWLSSA
jgi:hypothetical protein